MFIWMLFMVMVVLLIGTTPVWPHSRQWGYYPSSGLSLILIVFLCLWLFGGLASFGHEGWWHTAAPALTR